MQSSRNEFPHFLTFWDPSQTIREKRRQPMTSRRRESGALSRASLVYGSSHNGSDKWYDVDAFLLDQVREVLQKLSEGTIDDEIWGKIVIMERCKRVAKAYLRKTTVIIDGSEDEFDGKTLGFNFFENPERDEQTKEIRAKIGDGLILKMDLQGNIKGMARGSAPVICQGYRGEKHSCVSDRLIRQQGRLNGNNNEEEKAYKMFDMRKFKHVLDRDIHDGIPDPRSLLLRTCVRVALVKDGVDMSKTPCWFSIVNLVALDMLKEKVPNIASLVQVEFDRRDEYQRTSKTLGPSSLSQETITQIIAAAVSQVNKGMSTSMQSLPVSQEQLAHLASSLSLGPGRSEPGRKDRRKTYHSSTSSLDSSGEETRVMRMADTRLKKWDVRDTPPDDFYDSGFDKTKERERKKPSRSVPSRPRLSDVVFNRSHSITSDYDSNREIFDSGSWSSTNSREFKIPLTKGRAPPPPQQESSRDLNAPANEPIYITKVEDNNTPILVASPHPPVKIYDEPFEARGASAQIEVEIVPSVLTEATSMPATRGNTDADEVLMANLNGLAIQRRVEITQSRPPNRAESLLKRGCPPLEAANGRQANPFFNELRQRGAAMRLPRNYSQPGVRGGVSVPGISSRPRGLRRTHNLPPSPRPDYAKPQIRVSRTASLPWTAWESAAQQQQRSRPM